MCTLLFHCLIRIHQVYLVVLQGLDVLLALDLHLVPGTQGDLEVQVRQGLQKVLVVLNDQGTLLVQGLPSGLVHLMALEDHSIQQTHVLLVVLVGPVVLVVQVVQVDQVDLDLCEVQNVIIGIDMK